MSLATPLGMGRGGPSRWAVRLWPLLLLGPGLLMVLLATARGTAGPQPLSWPPLVGGMLVVGALLLWLPALVRRLASGARGRGPRRIEVLEVQALGPRRSLVLARVGDQQVLIGSAEGGLTALARWPDPAADSSGESGEDFAGVLRRVDDAPLREALS